MTPWHPGPSARPDADALTGLDAYEGCGAGASMAMIIGTRSDFVGGAVLQVDQHPVEPGACHDLGAVGRGAEQEHAEDGLVGEDAAAQCVSRGCGPFWYELYGRVWRVDLLQSFRRGPLAQR